MEKEIRINTEDMHTIYSGITFNDPTGDIKRIRSCIYSLLRLVDYMNEAWDEATTIDNISIRQNVMQRLSESIENLMNLIQSADRALIYEFREKEI